MQFFVFDFSEHIFAFSIQFDTRRLEQKEKFVYENKINLCYDQTFYQTQCCYPWGTEINAPQIDFRCGVKQRAEICLRSQATVLFDAKKNAPSILFWFVAIMLKHHNQPLLLGNFDWF